MPIGRASGGVRHGQAHGESFFSVARRRAAPDLASAVGFWQQHYHCWDGLGRSAPV